MILFDAKNSKHQTFMVMLTVSFWANGEVKDIYQTNSEEEKSKLEDFKATFELKDDIDIEKWLSIHAPIYEDSDHLRIQL